MSKEDGRKPEQAGSADEIARITREALPDKQQRAIELLVTGMNYQDVAKSVDISREQLWRWRTKDQPFMAALDRLRSELHESVVDGFWGGLVPKALAVAAESLEERDPDMALAILRLAARGITDVHLPDPGTPPQG